MNSCKRVGHAWSGAALAVLMVLAHSAAQTPAQRPRAVPTDSSKQILDRIIATKVPVLMDFWAPWCGPCRMLHPIVKEIETIYRGRIVVERINIDIHRGLAAYFGISAIPAVFIVKNKEVINSIPGLRSKDVYVKAVEEALAAPPVRRDSTAVMSTADST